jgi:hypothetical protein
MTVQPVSAADAGIVAAWGQRVAIPADVWQEVVGEAKTEVDLFGTALGGFTRPAMLDLARRKLAEGCRFRLLLQSPYCDAAHSMAMQKDEAIDDKILASRSRLREFVAGLSPQERGLFHVRSYPSWMSISVFRGDDDLLVTHFLPWVIVDISPTLRVRNGENGVFRSYAKAIDGMWLHSDPLDLDVETDLPG